VVTKAALVLDVQYYRIYLLFGEIVQSVQLKTDKADRVYKAIHRVVHQQSQHSIALKKSDFLSTLM